MSETKSQTPETDANCLWAYFESRFISGGKNAASVEDCPNSGALVYSDFARSLEISRDQWKAVAERLAYPAENTECDCFYHGTELKECRRCQALTEFNQLKSTTEKP